MTKFKKHLIGLPLILLLGGISSLALANQTPGKPASQQPYPEHIYAGQAPGQSNSAASAGAKQQVDDAKARRQGMWPSVCGKNKEQNADGSATHCQ